MRKRKNGGSKWGWKDWRPDHVGLTLQVINGMILGSRVIGSDLHISGCYVEKVYKEVRK